MEKPGASQGESASDLISKRIAELDDWRGKTLGRMRTLIGRFVGAPQSAYHGIRSTRPVADHPGRRSRSDRRNRLLEIRSEDWSFAVHCRSSPANPPATCPATSYGR